MQTYNAEIMDLGFEASVSISNMSNLVLIILNLYCKGVLDFIVPFQWVVMKMFVQL